MNTYAYVSNNPLKFIDPLGLYSTNAHNQLLNNFGRRMGFSSQDIRSMQAGSAHADSFVRGYQGSDYSYMHAMTSSSIPNSNTARDKANQFIDERMNNYNNLRNSCDGSGNGRQRRAQRARAFFELGMAMHTVMDSTSPAHTGYQYWDSSQAHRHGPGMGGLRSRTEENWGAIRNNSNLINRTINLMINVYGGSRL